MRSESREDVRVKDNNDDDYDRKHTHFDQKSSPELSVCQRKQKNHFPKITMLIMFSCYFNDYKVATLYLKKNLKNPRNKI